MGGPGVPVAKSNPSAAERSLQASIAAHTRWAHDDGVAGTQAARDAFLGGFENEVDPSGSMHPAERARRAQHLRTAHMKRLALRSAQSRRRGGATVPRTPTAPTSRSSERHSDEPECATETPDTSGPFGDDDE
jgi:hypothetical protein